MTEELVKILVSKRMVDAFELINNYIEKRLLKEEIKGVKLKGGKAVLSKIGGEMIIKMLTNDKSLTMEIEKHSNGINKYNVKFIFNPEKPMDMLNKIVEGLIEESKRNIPKSI